ncbi:MAG: glycosyltransferase [Phycisphaerales bacterium]|jgi:GT2 family glycosyltransferase
MDKKLTASIVVHKPNIETFTKALNSVLNSPLISTLYVIDNSPSESVKLLCSDQRIKYIFSKSNIGFGRAHNIAIARSVASNSVYHIVMNPDIYFEDKAIEKAFNYMNDNEDVGLLMPKVLYPDGSIQYLCKLLPCPSELILRRFLPFKKLLDARNYIYELRFTGYDKIIDAPYLSGCFMFLRTKVLKEVGLFDERFFLYFEDLDLTRRINLYYRTIYFPKAVIYHHYQKGSYKSIKLLVHHLISAIKYFNKWGGIFDKSRRQINLATLRELGYSGK